VEHLTLAVVREPPHRGEAFDQHDANPVATDLSLGGEKRGVVEGQLVGEDPDR
jgi:hypothetical protein